MLKIAVCDDEVEACQQIEDNLLQIKKDLQLDMKVFYFSNGKDVLESMPYDIDILLLDIQMDGINGMDVAKTLRKRNNQIYIIFITTKVEYAIEGYEVHAYAFLRKPIQYVLLKKYISEINEYIVASKPIILYLNNKNITEKLDISQIIYIEVYGHTTSFILDNDRKEYSISLNEIEDKVKNHGFFRCHKSYIVNLRKILKITSNEITMSNNDIIPLSKYRRKDFLDEFTKIIGEQL